MDGRDDEVDASVKGPREGRERKRREIGLAYPANGASASLPLQLKAMIRIKSKYLRRLRSDHSLGPHAPVRNALPRTSSPEVTSDRPQSPHRRKGQRRRSRVLFPSDNRKYLPKNKDRSRAKPFLILFFFIVFLQVYNAIENLDDHVEKFDLEGLEKTLDREVFGHQEALEKLIYHLSDYLSTYAHQRPLALSLHGASGVGKSHIGRILARHFRSVVGEEFVVQYFPVHHCPPQLSAKRCADEFTHRVNKVVAQAEEEEQIPLFILDEVDLIRPPLLDALQKLLQPGQTNEYLNVVYIFLSSLGEAEIMEHILQNASTTGVDRQLRKKLAQLHPLWADSEVVLIPLSLLERSHVVQCFLEEMTDEGFYPDNAHLERLAGELAYHRAGGKEYAKSGCKQVVAKVNLM